MINEYYEKAYQEWYNNYDENNPYELHDRGLISDEDFINWLEQENKKELFAKRKQIAETILSY